MSTFPTHDLNTDNAAAKEALEASKEKFGFVANLFTTMAEAPQSIHAYLDLVKHIEASSLTPAQAQLVQLAISGENGCDFCTTAHIAVGKMVGAEHAELLKVKNKEPLSDPKDDALVTFARQIVEKRGWLDDADLKAFFDAGFAHQQVFEIILCAAAKTITNYSNHFTKPEPNPELVAGAAA